MKSRTPLVCVALALACGAPRIAVAQTTTSAPASSTNDAVERAEAEFRAGREAVAQGDYRTACTHFERSQELDPQLGTLLNLAVCNKHLGKPAAALRQFREAAALARSGGHTEQEQGARAYIAELEREVPKLVVEVRDRTTPGLRVEFDGTPLAPNHFGQVLEAEPGTHTLVASAPGREPFHATVELTLGQTHTVAIPELAEAPAPADAGTQTELDTRRILAIASGAVGVAGVAVGTVFGFRSMSKKSDADRHCDGSQCTTQEGVRLREEAISAGNVSTVAFVIGAAGLAGGAVLWLTAPDSQEPELAVAIGPGSFALRGTF
ncbi:MAG: hypothetical protein DIU78_008280 [Pseudomonadota bacterium]|nr:MAG: hypothetical protein DIU78_06810 [Pseudomonadota bacterium]